MVNFCYTPRNVKILKNILEQYAATTEISPYEYMSTYVEKNCNNFEEFKLTWMADTFLGIQKHYPLLNEIVLCVNDDLHEEDKEYFIIMFYAIVFNLTFEDVQLLYKCLFKLSKSLLHVFCNFVSKSDLLPLICQITQSIYDTSYAKENIIKPLIIWQPYICEMGNSYAEYLKNIEIRKRKPPTIPVQPVVLSRKMKTTYTKNELNNLPGTPPNSLKFQKRMLTKTEIDKILKDIHEKNKQNALKLLNDVKSKTFHYGQVKSEKYHRTISSIKEEISNKYSKSLPTPKQTYSNSTSLPPIKDNVANLRRTNRKIQVAQEEEIKWLQNILTSCSDTTKVYELEEIDRKEKEQKRILDIEKKHLIGQLSYEEAVIAKKKVQEENRLKYEEFLKERETWNQEIEKWKNTEIEKNRRNIEKISILELNILQAKNEVTARKKETAVKLKQETEKKLNDALKLKREELDRKVNMIKEIKILAMLAKKTIMPKIIDLTESSGVGLLCEMSVAELQERLMALKITLNEELQKKKKLIKEEQISARRKLEETKTNIENYMNEKAMARKKNANYKKPLEVPISKEIDELKRILDEKRKQRAQLTA